MKSSSFSPLLLVLQMHRFPCFLPLNQSSLSPSVNDLKYLDVMMLESISAIRNARK